MPSLTLRPMAPLDRDRLLAWRNDPFIVARSTSRRPVEADEHASWFARILASPDALCFIAELEGTPVGHARFERIAPETCVITAYLLPAHTGRGLGVTAIRLGCASARARWPGIRVVACVRDDNAAGRSAFVRAGFLPGAAGCCPAAHATLVLAGDAGPGAGGEGWR